MAVAMRSALAQNPTRAIWGLEKNMEIADTPESTLMMQRAFMRCMIECDSRIERQKAGLVLQPRFLKDSSKPPRRAVMRRN